MKRKVSNVKYVEWCNGKSLFSEIEQLAPNSIITVLGAEQLNLLYMMRFGSRDLVPSLEYVSVSAVATMLQKIYLDKWQRLADIYLHDFGIGFEDKTETISSDVELSNKDVSTNATNKTVAYNDDELIENSGTIDSLTEVGGKENTTTVTVTKTSLKSIEFQRALLENSHISSIICKDVTSLVSLAIY